MRVKLISDQWGPNPHYDDTKREYEQPHKKQRIVPAGTVLDGPLVYLFMKNGQAVAEDDEARDWWDNYTGRVAARQEAAAALLAKQAADAAKFDDQGEEDDDSAED